MPLVGLCGEPKEALEKIEYMMQALSLQGQFSEEEPVRAEKNRQTEFVRITEKSAEARCMPWRKVSPSSQFPSAISAVT